MTDIHSTLPSSQKGERPSKRAIALLVKQAELHAEDMRSFLPGGTRNKRTEEQRGADAFILLVDRLEEALMSRTADDVAT